MSKGRRADRGGDWTCRRVASSSGAFMPGRNGDMNHPPAQSTGGMRKCLYQ
jgi:hypothetical protein